ncbi:MAG: acyl-CoA thioesterase [Actinomycetota bacterium]
MIHRQTFKLGLDGVDAFGIIYFGQYQHWFQQAQEGLLEDAGHALREILDGGLGFPIVHFEMDFFRPLRLSDTVEAECRLLEAGKRSLRFCVRFFDPTGHLAAEARSVQVATGADFSPRPVPDWLRAAVEVRPPEPVPVGAVPTPMPDGSRGGVG